MTARTGRPTRCTIDSNSKSGATASGGGRLRHVLQPLGRLRQPGGLAPGAASLRTCAASFRIDRSPGFDCATVRDLRPCNASSLPRFGFTTHRQCAKLCMSVPSADHQRKWIRNRAQPIDAAANSDQNPPSTRNIELTARPWMLSRALEILDDAVRSPQRQRRKSDRRIGGPHGREGAASNQIKVRVIM